LDCELLNAVWWKEIRLGIIMRYYYWFIYLLYNFYNVESFTIVKNHKPCIVWCRWSGRYIWGVSYEGLNVHSAGCPLPDAASDLALTSCSVVLSTSEDAEIIQRLRGKFTVVYAAGAGYKILCTVDRLVASYVLSRSNTFKWDTCAPHAILLAMGGGIVDFCQAVEATRHGQSTDEVATNCQLCYNRANDGYPMEAVERWSNNGGVVAYCNTDVLANVLAALASTTDWHCCCFLFILHFINPCQSDCIFYTHWMSFFFCWQARWEPQRGPRKHSCGVPQTFSQGPSREKILEFFFSEWCILVYFIFLGRDFKFIFVSKFEFPLLNFGLNSNFVYIFVEKLKQFAFDVCIVRRGEGHSTHATRREAVYQHGLRSIAVDWCLLCVWATKICHFDSLHQYTMESNWTPWRYAGRGEEG